MPTFTRLCRSLSLLFPLILLITGVLLPVTAAERRLDTRTSAGPATGSGSANRVALLIGNSDYTESPLGNPANDVRAFSEALQRIGFEVIVRKNATHREMDESINEFWQLLKGKAVGLFYYSGHGLQVNGENYLVPIKAAIKTEIDIRHECYAVQKILDYMQDARPGLSLIILDACRNNPFRRGLRSVARGLAPMTTGKQVLLAFATDPHNVAQDGDPQGNSPYMKHMLRHLEQPGMPIENFFKEVRKGVLQDTNGEQTPWESSNLTDDFAFVAAPSRSPFETSAVPATPDAPGAKKGPLIDVWIKEAEKGNLDAMYIVADAYERGEMEVAVDLTKAFTWYTRAAEKGHADSMTSLSRMLAEGRGCARDAPLSRTWLEKAAQAGSASARQEVAEQNERLRDLRAAAEKGNPFARFELWRVENLISEDPAVQERELLPAAEKGDEKAFRLLCTLYLRELEVGTPETRRTWLAKLVPSGDRNELFLIARQHQTGIGLPRDFERAAELYRRARDLGHPNAAQELQELYDAGHADPQDDQGLAQSLDGLKEKAARGDPKAQIEYAIKLAKGEGTPIDMPGAIEWTRKAAEQRYPRGLTNLGQMHLVGHEGIREDPKEGLSMLEQAAAGGDPEAVVTLMKWHQEAKPTSAGPVEALAWAYILIKRSDSLGESAWAYRDAGNIHVERLARELSKTQIQQARRRETELLKRIPDFRSF